MSANPACTENDSGVGIETCVRGLCLRRCGNVFDDNGAHTREIESAQEGIHTQLTGSRQIHQKLHQQIAALAEFPGKLINTGNLVSLSGERKKFEALVG